MPITPTPTPAPGATPPPDDKNAAPGSGATQKLREEWAKSVIEAGKLKKAQLELEEAIEKGKKSTTQSGEETRKLTKLQGELKDAYDILTESTRKYYKEMQDAEKLHNRAIKTYSQVSSSFSDMAQKANGLLTTYHSYNLEVQKLVEMTGKFTGRNKYAIESFERMRSELKLTRKEAEEFGKTWAQGLRLGLNTDQITKATKQLQSVLGQKEGIAAAGRIMQAPVSQKTMGALMTAQPSAARGTAMAEAMQMGTLEQARDISALRGGPKGPGAERAVRFEAATAKAAVMKDDIQGAMAAALDLGMGPEMGALAVPLMEINKNIAKLVEEAVGQKGWLKTALTTKPEGAGGGGITDEIAGKIEDAVGESLKGVGKQMGEAFKGGGGFKGGAGAFKAAGRAGLTGLKTALPGLGGMARTVLGGGVGLGIAGTAADWASDKYLSGGWKKAGKIGAAGLQGAAMGSMIGGPIGTGVGAAVGLGYGTYKQFEEPINKAVKDFAKGAGDMAKAAVGYADAIETVDVAQSMLDLKTALTELPKSLDNTIAAIGLLPSVLEDQIAQSRLPTALQSIDPGPIMDTLDKASAAYTDTVDKLNSEMAFQMKELDERAKPFQKIIEQKGEKSEEGAAAKRTLQTIESERKQATIKVEQQKQKVSLVTKAQIAGQYYETQKGQIGQETQAVTMAYERKYAGTGNVEEMQKVADQIAKGSDQTLDIYKRTTDKQKELYRKQVESSEFRIKNEKLNDHDLGVEQNLIDQAKRGLENLDRQIPIVEEEIATQKQKQLLENKLEQAMAATQTTMFKVSQRQMALLKAQESFARERGTAPEEVGKYAEAQAGEAQTQLNAFMESFAKKSADLRKDADDTTITAAARQQIELKIKDLADERVKLENQALTAALHAATAEEKHRQDLLGANKKISEIQRDTAAKFGMSWRVQMSYQTEIIKLSQQEFDSKRKEVVQMGDALKAAGGDPQKNEAYLKAVGELASKWGEVVEQTIGKQRSFLEQSTAASFGVGSGSKLNPIINPRMMGEMFQGAGGVRQQVGRGGGPGTFQEVQQQRMKEAALRGMGGGIGAGVPGPGNAPGLAAGQPIPPAAGGPGAPIVPQAGAALLGGNPALRAGGKGAGEDISGAIQVNVVMNTNLFTTEVTKMINRVVHAKGQ